MAKSAVDQYAVQDSDLDMRSLGLALWRRKHWVIWPTLLVAIAAGITVNLLTPRYKSEARIVYDGRENVFLRPDAERSLNQDRGPADPEALTDQVQTVLSRQLALEVIGELKLNELPEFDPVLRGTSLVRHVLSLAGIARNLLAMTPEERVLESWNDRLTAYAVEKSRVIVIEFQSSDPMLAARITNAIAAAYLRRQQEVRQEQTRGAGVWLANEIDKLRPKVAEAEAKAETFRSNTNLLVGTNNTTLSNQQLGEFNAQLNAARGQMADAETRARIIRDMLRKGEAIESSDVVNSELIRRLSEQRVTLRAQLAEQSSTLLDGHPRIKELKAQIADLDRQIRAEAEKLIRSLENEAHIASARVDALSANLDVLKKQASSTNGQDVQYRALEREAKAQRDLLESYLAKYRETTARDSIGSAPPDAKIISSAIVSNTPAFPKKLPIVAVATLIAFVLCAGLVTTSELMRAVAAPRPMTAREPKFAEPAEPPAHEVAVEPADVPLAARVEPPAAKIEPSAAPPLVPAEPAEPVDAPHPALGVPLGAIQDVARRLRENRGIGSCAAVFTARPELATTLPALTLARTLATDAKVVLVGLVKPAPVLEAISLQPSLPGLTDVIRGAASFGQIIGKDRLSRLHLVHYGLADLPLRALCGSPQFVVMMQALSRAYTHVIVDAGALSGDCGGFAAVAPRSVLIAPDNAPQEIATAVQMLVSSGFADIAVMTSGAMVGPDALVAA
jgi:polysaccharide biosynthesis transport protein